MKKFLHRIWNILRYPRGAFLLCFYALFALTVAGTVLLLIFAPEKNALHYILYALSAVGLGYFVYTVIIFAVPEGKACAIRFLQRHSFTDNILKSYGFRTLAFAAAGLIVNIAYAVWLTVGLIVQAIRNINLVDAIYSVFVLQVSMIRAFGDGNDPLSNSVAGGAIALLILWISIHMIVQSYREKERLDQANQ